MLRFVAENSLLVPVLGGEQTVLQGELIARAIIPVIGKAGQGDVEETRFSIFISVNFDFCLSRFPDEYPWRNVSGVASWT